LREASVELLGGGLDEAPRGGEEGDGRAPGAGSPRALV